MAEVPNEEIVLESIELRGLIFEPDKFGRYKVLDLNYGMQLGFLSFQEGPGWILDTMATFMDYGHFKVLAEFIESRMAEVKHE